MRQIKHIIFNSFHIYEVISEPGDATHYHYLIINEHNSPEFFICRGKNTFKYPEVINYWDWTNVLDKLKTLKTFKEKCFYLVNFFKKYPEIRETLNNSNPYTVLEVLTTIAQLWVS
jgi:hypothetical protein